MTFRGRVYSEDVAITQEATWQDGTPFTTTSLAWQRILNVDIFIPNSHVTLFEFANLLVDHSVSGGLFDVDIEITADTLGYYVIDGRNAVAVATSGDPVPVSLGLGLDVVANLPRINRGASYTMSLWIKNRTAGTLTVCAGLSRGGTLDQYALFGFVTGDDSV